MTYRTVGLKAAREAAKIHLKYFGKGVSKTRKHDDSYVSKADLESSKKVRSIISAVYPKHSIVCEEFGETNPGSDYRWIVDPIDGTHNFLMDCPLYAISIALAYKGEVIMGIVLFPSLKRLYFAEKGKGATCNGKKIHVSGEKRLDKAMMIFDAKLRTKSDLKLKILKRFAKSVWRIRVWGVAVYHILQVAEGHAGFTIDFDSHSWDYSAALMILEEAGGKATDINGNPWHTEVGSYVGSNGHLHNRVIACIKKSCY